MSIQVMSITLLELQNWMNIGVETALRALESKGKLTESANAILEKHAIILQEKGSLEADYYYVLKNGRHDVCRKHGLKVPFSIEDNAKFVLVCQKCQGNGYLDARLNYLGFASTIRPVNAVGCPDCKGKGFLGRPQVESL